ncbi:MAG: 4-alpha-glucanotransferase, partial [Planctomycetota bacterium]
MRSSGILLHPTSLPSRFGIGDLGPGAYRFLEWLAAADQHVWQILPLGPIEENGSPYTSSSAFAGNPLLVSPELLAESGLLSSEAVNDAVFPGPENAPVDYPAVVRTKRRLLGEAFRTFQRLPAAHPLQQDYEH